MCKSLKPGYPWQASDYPTGQASSSSFCVIPVTAGSYSCDNIVILVEGNQRDLTDTQTKLFFLSAGALKLICVKLSYGYEGVKTFFWVFFVHAWSSKRTQEGLLCSLDLIKQKIRNYFWIYIQRLKHQVILQYFLHSHIFPSVKWPWSMRNSGFSINMTKLILVKRSCSPLSHVQETFCPSLVSAHINVCSLHSPNEQRSISTEQSFPLNPAKKIELTMETDIIYMYKRSSHYICIWLDILFGMDTFSLTH